MANYGHSTCFSPFQCPDCYASQLRFGCSRSVKDFSAVNVDGAADLKWIFAVFSDYLDGQSLFTSLSKRVVALLLKTSISTILKYNIKFWALIISTIFILDPKKTTVDAVESWVELDFVRPLRNRLCNPNAYSDSPKQSPAKRRKTNSKAPTPAETEVRFSHKLCIIS